MYKEVLQIHKMTNHWIPKPIGKTLEYIPSDTLFYLTKNIQIKTKMTYFGNFLKVAIASISRSVKKKAPSYISCVFLLNWPFWGSVSHMQEKPIHILWSSNLTYWNLPYKIFIISYKDTYLNIDI